MTKQNKPSDDPSEPNQHDVAILALKVMAETGWSRLTLTHIADQGQMALEDLHKFATDKTDLLDLIGDYLEDTTETINDHDKKDLEPNEIIFEVFMARFDALAPHKHALTNLYEDVKLDPVILHRNIIPHGIKRINTLASQAGCTFEGPFAPLQKRAFALLYTKLLHTWLEDDSEDLSKTMAACDKTAKTYVPIIFDPCKIMDLL